MNESVQMTSALGEAPHRPAHVDGLGAVPESRWVRVTACDNIPPREGRAVIIAGREIAIFNLGDGFLAIDNRCPHRGGPLSDGIVAGTAVVCPLHGWKVCLETGAVERPADARTCIRAYATRVDAGVVMIEWTSHADAQIRTTDGMTPDEGSVA